MSQLRNASPGEAVVFRTKDGVIYLGDVVEYDAPEYRMEREQIAAVSVEAAFEPSTARLRRDDSNITDGSNIPEEITTPDDYHDGVVCIADFDGQAVLLEWAGVLRRDGLYCYRTGASTEIESAESGQIVRPEMVMTDREEAVTNWGAL